MIKDGIAVDTTFLVAKMQKEIAGSENGECQRRLNRQREEGAAVVHGAWSFSPLRLGLLSRESNHPHNGDDSRFKIRNSPICSLSEVNLIKEHI